MPVSYSPALDVADDPAYDPTDKPFVPAAGSAAALLFYDTFTDTAFTTIASHTPDTDNTGSGWTRVSSASTEFQIGSSPANTLHINNPALGEVCYVTNSATPYAFRTSPVSGVPRFMLRYVDADNFWWASTEVSASFDARIYERTGATNTKRAEVLNEDTSGATWFYMTDDGSTITFGYDTEGTSPLLSYSATTHNSSASFGFTGNGADHYTDDFIAYTGTTDPSDLVTP